MALRFNAQANFGSQAKFVKTVLNNMKTRQTKPNTYGMLINGDPGTGKTSSVKELSTLLGLELLVIEAPHVLEEHLIKIPFIVYDPVKKSTKALEDETKLESTNKNAKTDTDTSDFRVIHSKGYLAQELAKKTKLVEDDKYIEYIYKQDKNTIGLYEELGGTKEEIPFLITEVREEYSKVLFIDEYFRTEGPKIRNIFRRILNGWLGDTRMPPMTYVIYASNMNDDGLDKQSSHQVFERYNMQSRTKDEWFSWFVNKFEDDNKGIKLNEDLLNSFHEALTDKHMSYNYQAAESEIRTSPRRWEQVLLYINEALPVSTKEKAITLMSNIKSMFSDKNGESSDLYDDTVFPLVQKMIEKDGIKLDSGDMANHEDSWEDTLRHQIELKMKLKEHRTYVPVISGSPGIGKTHTVEKIAKELGLQLLYMDATSINKDDVVGMPLVTKTPNKRDREAPEMQFDMPRMLHMVEEEIEHTVKKQIAAGEKPTRDSDSEFKYLFFIDELDKVDSKTVFNAIRKVLLEKNFSNKWKLPEGTVVLSAINPSGVEGSFDFTGHMADVVDIIHAKPNWKNFITNIIPKEKIIKEGEPFREKLTSVLEAFVNKFKSPKNEGGEFNINIDGPTVYVSPRDYGDMFSKSVTNYRTIVEELKRKKTNDLTQYDNDVKDAVYEAYAGVLDDSINRAELNPAEFLANLKEWFETNPDFSFLLKDVTVKASAFKGKEALSEGLKELIKNPKAYINDDHKLSSAFVGYFMNIDAPEFAKDLTDFVEEDLIEGGEKEVELHKPIKNYLDDDNEPVIHDKEGADKFLKKVKAGVNQEKDPKKKKELDEEYKELKEELEGMSDEDWEKGAKELEENGQGPIKTTKAHGLTYELFKGEHLAEFIENVKEHIFEITGNHSMDSTVDRVLGTKLKQLRKKYLRKDVVVIGDHDAIISAKRSGKYHETLHGEDDQY